MQRQHCIFAALEFLLAGAARDESAEIHFGKSGALAHQDCEQVRTMREQFPRDDRDVHHRNRRNDCTISRTSAGTVVSLREAMSVKCASSSGANCTSRFVACPRPGRADRKSTRLNSSHVAISYAVFCLKKKKTQKKQHSHRQH